MPFNSLKTQPEILSTPLDSLEVERHEIDQRIDTPDLTDEQKDDILRGLNERLDRMSGQQYVEYPDELLEVQDWLARVARATKSWDQDRISTAHAQALKYFSAGLLEKLCLSDRSDDQPENKKNLGNMSKVDNIYQAYFAGSPSIMSYVGGIDGQVELLSFAGRSRTTRGLVGNMSNEIIDSGGFSDSPALFTDLIEAKSPVAQVELIQTIAHLAEYALEQGDLGTSFSDKTRRGLVLVANNQDAAPFVRIVAADFVTNINDSSEENWISLADFPADQQAKLVKDHKLFQAQDAQMQRQLHDHFPSVDQTAYLQLIAPETVAVVDKMGRPEVIINRDGYRTNLADITSFNDLQLTEQQALLFRTLYTPTVAGRVQSELGLPLQGINLDIQSRLVQFMIEATPQRYGRLVSALKTAGESRQALAEVFLATEFGDDFGDTILSIIEHASAQQSEKLFDLVNDFREHSRAFSGWFKDFDPGLSRSAERAMNERFTDALCAVEEVARRGQMTVDTAPHRNNLDYEHDGRFDISVDSLDEAIDTLGLLDATVKTMRAVLSAPDVQVQKSIKDDDWFQIYRFSSQDYGQLLLHVRPYGASRFDKRYEYGNRDGVEATVSFVVNPIDPYSLQLEKDPNGVSLRFDREGRTVDEAPNSLERHPTRKDGSISVDISSIMGKTGTPAVQIGRLVAAGNLLRASHLGTAESLHHNTNHFDQPKYGDADGFASLVEYVRNVSEAMIASQWQQVAQLRVSRHLGATADRSGATSAA